MTLRIQTLIMSAVLVCLTSTFSNARADEGAFEFRTHWSSVKSDGTPNYEATTIVEGSDTEARRTVLVRDPGGETWKLSDAHDFAGQVMTMSIEHLPSGEYVRQSTKVPMKARTRTAALAEFAKSRLTADHVMTIETTQVSRTAPESEWRDRERSANMRSEIRVSLSTRFLDSVDRMAETLFPHEPNLNPVRTLLGLLSHSEPCEATNRYSKRVNLDPACNFDKSLGMPCSKRQLKRIESAERRGSDLTRY